MNTVLDISGRVHIAFEYAGMQCSEPVGLPVTKANMLLAKGLLDTVRLRIENGDFSYCMFFPDSKLGNLLPVINPTHAAGGRLQFANYARQWYSERKRLWRASYASAIEHSIERYLIPEFGYLSVDAIDKNDILRFRIGLIGRPNLRNGAPLGPNRINQIMHPLRMIVVEAAGRFGHRCQWHGIQPLRGRTRSPNPMSLAEVERFLKEVRSDFRDYYEFRFFTGLRASEIHGLDWEAVSIQNSVAHVRQAFVGGKLVVCKTAGSHRIVSLNKRALQALRNIRDRHGSDSGAVFVGGAGNRLQNSSISRDIWYPTLAAIGITRRLPHTSRHTIATLWLAAGESPQWIARQLGHADTQMLFRVYGRYVPNAVQVDGAAFNSFIEALPSQVLNRRQA